MGAFPPYDYFTDVEADGRKSWRLSVDVGPTPIDIEYLEYSPGDSGLRSPRWAPKTGH